MPYRMECPKCQSQTFHIERERRYYSKADPVASLIMSCACGLRLYGKQVEDEYKRQKKEYEASAEAQAHAQQDQVSQVKRSRRDQLRAARAYHEEFVANSRIRTGDEADLNAGAEGSNSAAGPAKSKAATKHQAPAVDNSFTQHPDILPSNLLSTPDGVKSVSNVAASDDSNACSWHACTRGQGGGRAAARKNSKYCSRACSNANARWRFKHRNREDDEA